MSSSKFYILGVDYSLWSDFVAVCSIFDSVSKSFYVSSIIIASSFDGKSLGK